MDHEKALAYAKANGYDGAEYLGLCEGFFCYAPFFNHPTGEGVPPTGLPSLILVDQNGDMRFLSPEEMLMYGKEASNRKQEIDRQHYTIPNQRPKDKHCGKI